MKKGMFLQSSLNCLRKLPQDYLEISTSLNTIWTSSKETAMFHCLFESVLQSLVCQEW